MSSVVTSRKKGNIPDTVSDETAESDSPNANVTDVEEGEPCLPSAREKSKKLTFPPAVTRTINYLSSFSLVELNKALFVLVIVLSVLIIVAPAHVRKRRNEILKKQYDEATESLNQKYEYLQKTINGENDRLVDDLYEIVGLVQKEHHDGEIQTKESTIDKLSMDSKSALLKKQLEIDSIKAEMQKHKDEMEKVKALLHDVNVKPENFCDECVTEKGVKCKSRRTYLTTRYKTPLEEAVTVVAKQSPSCFKKDSNKDILAEIAEEEAAANVEVVLDDDGHVKPENFCDKCIMPGTGSYCRARVDFLHTRYGTPEQEGIDLVVKSDKSCYKKSP